MTRNALSHNPVVRRLHDVAGKLIGFGGLLVLMPLLWVRSPFGVVTRAFAPFGWLALLVGFGLLTLEMRRHVETVRSTDRNHP